MDAKAEAAGRSAVRPGGGGGRHAQAAEARPRRSRSLTGRVNQVETSARRLIYEVTLSEDEGDFTFGDAALPDEAKARLDQMVTS